MIRVFKNVRRVVTIDSNNIKKLADIVKNNRYSYYILIINLTVWKNTTSLNPIDDELEALKKFVLRINDFSRLNLTGNSLLSYFGSCVLE